jgi:hypothetical protein
MPALGVTSGGHEDNLAMNELLQLTEDSGIEGGQ